MKRHGKKNHLWVDIILYAGMPVIIIPTLLLLVLLYLLVVGNSAENQSFWEPITVEVVNPVNKDYNIHILTHSELSTLYSYGKDWRLVNTNTKIVEMDYDEAQLLMKICRAEGGTGLLGQLWVMRTVINRVYDDRFPDTITGVITDTSCGIQFETYTSGAYKVVELNSNSHMALGMLESGWDETEGALYFEASSNSKNSWHIKNLQFIKEVEGNRFYK